MNYLLDTNIYIFWLNEDIHRMSKEQLDILENSSNQLWISSASLHELAIKVRKGSNPFNISYQEAINEISKRKVKVLELKQAHYDKILNLPFVSIKVGSTKSHGDPFDLLIIAQAICEKIPVLSTDEYFPIYDEINVVI